MWVFVLPLILAVAPALMIAYVWSEIPDPQRVEAILALIVLFGGTTILGSAIDDGVLQTEARQSIVSACAAKNGKAIIMVDSSELLCAESITIRP